MYPLIISVLVIITLWVISMKKTRFKYWQKRGVPTLANQNLIFGDFARTFMGKENFITSIDAAYREFKSRGCKIGGIYAFNNPMLLVMDSEILRLILVKDFDFFMDRGVDYDVKERPLSGHIFNMNGDDWRFVRKKLTPTFTSGKLKTMFWIIEEHVDKLCGVIRSNYKKSIYLTDLLERSGMDIISQTAFGIKNNVLENEVSPFYLVTKKILQPSIHRVIYYAFKNVFKNLSNLILLLTDDKKCNEFFLSIVEETINYRKENNVRINDLIQLLIDSMEPKDGEEGLSLETVAAQAFGFFVAAYETTAKTVNMVLYELSKDSETQRKLREEIVGALEEADEKFSYEMVSKCKFLDMIVTETLRKDPPVVYLNRVCRQNYKIPDTDIEIEKGTAIIVPVYSIHMDPENYPNPEQFDVYRFSKENEGNLKPYTYFPFGEGPRNCIGSRLGLYQVKLFVMKLITNFEVSPSPKTEEPLTLNPITGNLLLQFQQKIYYDFKPLNCN